jgi:hypothetical protein
MRALFRPTHTPGNEWAATAEDGLTPSECRVPARLQLFNCRQREKRAGFPEACPNVRCS